MKIIKTDCCEKSIVKTGLQCGVLEQSEALVFERGYLSFCAHGWQGFFSALRAPRAAWTLRELLLAAELWSNEWAWQNIFRVEREKQAEGIARVYRRGGAAKDGLLSKSHGGQQREPEVVWPKAKTSEQNPGTGW